MGTKSRCIGPLETKSIAAGEKSRESARNGKVRVRILKEQENSDAGGQNILRKKEGIGSTKRGGQQ